MRDNIWLQEKMYELWENHFVDVPRKNIVLIKFGKRAQRQLGAIKWVSPAPNALNQLLKKYHLSKEDDTRISLIAITSYFKDPQIPEQIVLATIAHEMCHYAHGFNSPLKQLYAHPHKGGVIRKEMEKRGLDDMYKQANKWLKANWLNYLKNNRKKSFD